MANSHTFYSVSAPAGSGKTYALAEHTTKTVAQGDKVLIVQPTKTLMDQTEKAIMAKAPNALVTQIKSEPFGNSNVTGRVIEHMQNATPNVGEVLIISHEAFKRLPKNHRQFWHVFVDEIPSAFEPIKLNIAKTHHHITEHLKADEDLAVGGIVVVQAKSVVGLKALAKNQFADDGLAIFKDLAEAVLDDDKLVCVMRDNYERLVKPLGKEKTVTFFSILDPSFLDGFASVTMMGANMEATELYMVWDKVMNVTWKLHPQIGKQLRYMAHENGQRVTFKYLIEGNWSKNHAGQKHERGSNLTAVAHAMQTELGDDFLFQTNASVSADLFDDGDQIPTKPHGQNKPRYMRCDNVALTMAMNYDRPSARFLQSIGVDAEAVKIVLQYQNEYQAMMRCSLRDPQATNPVTICVVSRGSADWLSALFPDSKVEKLESDVPEPELPGRPEKDAEDKLTPAENVYNSTQRKKQKEAAARGEHFEPFIVTPQNRHLRPVQRKRNKSAW